MTATKEKIREEMRNALLVRVASVRAEEEQVCLQPFTERVFKVGSVCTLWEFLILKSLGNCSGVKETLGGLLGNQWVLS